MLVFQALAANCDGSTIEQWPFSCCFTRLPPKTIARTTALSGAPKLSQFNYLIEKIEKAQFTDAPFRHVYIEDFFTAADFDAIVQSREIRTRTASHEELFENLKSAGYKTIEFPGCITDKAEYIAWHAQKGDHDSIESSCEGFGLTMRLYDIDTPIVKDLNAFLASEPFNKAVAAKFDIDYVATTTDCGIQKYLDGYEISPHPDIRRKAATYMVNINPHVGSEKLNHHTHYLRFKHDRAYVQVFCETRSDCDRCWVPWDWCESVKTQTKNNSIVLFSPGNDTMHAVKADYDHLAGQRTQLYGNLWHHPVRLAKPNWEFFDGREPFPTIQEEPRSVTQKGLAGVLRKTIRKVRKTLSPAVSKDELGKRNYN